jgi:3-deoxy-D-manno-octulosonic acid (KDO) 8-phosphate synthase
LLINYIKDNDKISQNGILFVPLVSVCLVIKQIKMTIINLKNSNFFLPAGPHVIEGEEMALRIAEKTLNARALSDGANMLLLGQLEKFMEKPVRIKTAL